MDLARRLPPEFDLKSELLIGRAKVLTKTDCAVFRDSRTGKRTPCCYNYSPRQFVCNYKNWVFAQPVNDWCLGSFKGAYDLLGNLMGMRLVSSSGDGFPQTCGTAYQWPYPGLAQSASLSLEIPVLTPGELFPASSRD